VADEARCYLATQHQVVVNSVLERFPQEVEAHLDGSRQPVTPVLVSELVDIRDGAAVWDEHHVDKQPDWTYDPEWSGSSPVELTSDHRAG
jgi:hypothetical protein